MSSDELTASLRRIAAFGLPVTSAPAQVEVESGRWPAFLARLTEQRLTGLALAGQQAGLLRLTDPQARGLKDRHQSVMMWVLHLERCLLRLAADFHGEGIDMVVLKGPALANSVYPEPSWRPFGDLDPLVPARHWYRACEVLERAGYRRRLPEPRSGFSLRFGHTAMHKHDNGTEVDLHRTLVGGPFGLWMDPEGLFGMTTTFRLGDRELRRLDATAALVNACMHASLGFWPPLLIPLRDVAQIAALPEVDWDRVSELAERWKLQVVLQHALGAASQALDTPIPPEARPLLRLDSTRRERRALSAYTSDRRARGGTSLSNLAAIRGVRPKAAYLWALLVPSRAFLSVRASEGAPGSYLGRLMVPVRWLTTRAARRRRLAAR
jgi:Uncharacterised nucleotidyltransferase